MPITKSTTSEAYTGRCVPPHSLRGRRRGHPAQAAHDSDRRSEDVEVQPLGDRDPDEAGPTSFAMWAEFGIRPSLD